jgi:cation:H+ antiporter
LIRILVLAVLCLISTGYVLLDARSVTELVVGFVLLLAGAEALVRGAVALARRLGVSSLLVGLTVVAFGTSAPELATGITAVLNEQGELNIGNVVGSNIANIGLILGMTALFYPITCTLRVIRSEAPLMVGVVVLGIVMMFGGVVSRPEAGLMAMGLVVLLYRNYRAGLTEGEADRATERELEREFGETEPIREGRWWVSVLLIVAGLIGLVVGAMFLVSSAERIALSLGVPPVVIGLSMVAFGTSLPELATCLVAAMRREPDIVVGNVLGSNIFNILCVLGVTGLVGPIDVPAQTMRVDVWVMLGFAVVCLPIVWTGRRISRVEGGFLLVAYLVYVVCLFALPGASGG